MGKDPRWNFVMARMLAAREQTAISTPLDGWGRSVLLHRIKPELNQFRFYHIRIGPTLLDQHAVIRVWGRIGGHQRTMISPCQTDAEARTLADRLIRRRLKRGYTLVQDEMISNQ